MYNAKGVIYITTKKTSFFFDFFCKNIGNKKKARIFAVP